MKFGRRAMLLIARSSLSQRLRRSRSSEPRACYLQAQNSDTGLTRILGRKQWLSTTSRWVGPHINPVKRNHARTTAALFSILNAVENVRIAGKSLRHLGRMSVIEILRQLLLPSFSLTIAGSIGIPRVAGIPPR